MVVNVPPGIYNLGLPVTDPAGVEILGTAANVDIGNAGTATDLFETNHAGTTNVGPSWR